MNEWESERRVIRSVEGNALAASHLTAVCHPIDGHLWRARTHVLCRVLCHVLCRGFVVLETSSETSNGNKTESKTSNKILTSDGPLNPFVSPILRGTRTRLSSDASPSFLLSKSRRKKMERFSDGIPFKYLQKKYFIFSNCSNALKC